ncbi:MAG TPA: hypothetical protein VK517_05615 [Cyclobacteriaceae bacterium]|nr:hypothetical protein [Cyclobacteriaceae bacterium]
MKTVIVTVVILLSLSGVACCQGTNCSDVIATSTDKVTGKTITGIKSYLVISKDTISGFSIYFFRDHEQFKGMHPLTITIWATGASACIDEDSKINFLFRDGTRLELKNNGEYNCDAKFKIMQFIGAKRTDKRAGIEYLRTKLIETMRVWTTNGYVQEDFSDYQSELFKKVLNCLFEQ